MATSIHPLDQQHDVRSFDCGAEALNDWLKHTARQHQKKDISRTYVLVDDEAPHIILGFYAISICEVGTGDVPPDMAKKLPRNIPGMRLGRLATHLTCQGNKELRIGETLLVDAMARVKSLAKQAGGFALFVDAKDQNAAGFYKKYGFAPLPDDSLKLLMPIASIPE
jgi:hypothetical protein